MSFLLKAIAGFLRILAGLFDPTEILEDIETNDQVEEVVEKIEDGFERRSQPRDKDKERVFFVTIFYNNGEAMKQPLGENHFCIRDEQVFRVVDGKSQLIENAIGFNCYRVD